MPRPKDRCTVYALEPTRRIIFYYTVMTFPSWASKMRSISIYKRTSTTMPVNLLCPRTTLVFTLPLSFSLFLSQWRIIFYGIYRTWLARCIERSVRLININQPACLRGIHSWTRRTMGKKKFLAKNYALKFFSTIIRSDWPPISHRRDASAFVGSGVKTRGADFISNATWYKSKAKPFLIFATINAEHTTKNYY